LKLIGQGTCCAEIQTVFHQCALLKNLSKSSPAHVKQVRQHALILAGPAEGPAAKSCTGEAEQLKNNMVIPL
jgi:hypothetical protein